jgi:hypothetical protein
VGLGGGGLLAGFGAATVLVVVLSGLGLADGAVVGPAAVVIVVLVVAAAVGAGAVEVTGGGASVPLGTVGALRLMSSGPSRASCCGEASLRTLKDSKSSSRSNSRGT